MRMSGHQGFCGLLVHMDWLNCKLVESALNVVFMAQSLTHAISMTFRLRNLRIKRWREVFGEVFPYHGIDFPELIHYKAECRGLSLEDHILNSEVERVSLYDGKVGHFIDNLKGPKHRAVVVNLEAANRVIEHSIPHLTEEQKKGLQGIKRQCVEARQPRNLLHTPLQPARTQSITEAAAAFLEEARKELVEEGRRNEPASD
ncbi:hypothetical protein L7F22_055998 [Adiantum nelumboides]|nr:hypothetical protein [Adiantum nelumboides]